jgi:hypothetical protein
MRRVFYAGKDRSVHFRLTQPGDFQAALAFVPLAYRYAPRVRDALPELWSSLLRSGQLTSGVVEDPTATPGHQVLGVGLSVFVKDAFADEVLARPRPYLNAHLHELLLAGDAPVLSQREIAAQNAGSGLTLLPLHFCTNSLDVSVPDVLRALTAGQELFRILHSGYRVNRVVKEVVNVDLCRFMLSTGMLLATDYADQLPTLGLGALPESERPYLLTIRSSEMPLGSPMAAMFLAAPTRFAFSPAEQRVLLCALLRETDEEIARDLGLAQDTVRKHWKSAFQRVQSQIPGFFADNGDSHLEFNGNGRGREKRRYLLRHLQMHMEELRPN